LRLNTASNPSSTSWRLVCSIAAMLVSSAAAIRLSLQPSPSSDASAFSRMPVVVAEEFYASDPIKRDPAGHRQDNVGTAFDGVRPVASTVIGSR
jgi:hypothetical protein